ncbi:hypothetical protein ABEH28_11940 [Pseudomonas sp. Ps21-P2]|uniref:hypothetical protein n=1 Tax=Pseudomonas sp. Ps21-P2 TaxID=3080331 RepID=UPI003209BA18
MTNFLVVMLLDSRSFTVPSTMVYGSVELRSYSTDTPVEKEYLEASASEAGLDFAKYQVCARIATVVRSNNAHQAEHEAIAKFLEVLDFKSRDYAVSAIELSRIGLIKNLDSGEFFSLRREFQPSISFTMHRHSVQPYDQTNYLLEVDSKLIDRYRRSIHWARNAKNETNTQVKILFSWFALEALFKENNNDNSVESLMRLFIGFPNGKQIKLMSPSVKIALERHSRYKYWEKRLKDIVIKIRDFRNDSVHSGFTHMDFDRRDLELYDMVMTYALSRCQSGVLTGIHKNLCTINEFKEEAVRIFGGSAGLINDVHNNIIFSLERVSL